MSITYCRVSFRFVLLPMEGGESHGDQPINPSSFSTLHFNFLRNRINLSRLEQPAQNNNHYSKTERSLRTSSVKGMVKNAGLRPVSRPKKDRRGVKRKGRGNHLRHRLLKGTDTAKSSYSSTSRSSTSNEECR